MTAAAQELAEVELDAVFVDAEEVGALAVELGELAVKLDGALAVELDAEEDASMDFLNAAGVGELDYTHHLCNSFLFLICVLFE